MSQQCCATVTVHYGSLWPSSRQCERIGAMQDEKGRWYCRQHSPDAVAARKAKRGEAMVGRIRIARVQNFSFEMLEALRAAVVVLAKHTESDPDAMVAYQLAEKVIARIDSPI